MFLEFVEKCPVIIFGTGCPEVKRINLAQDLLLALCFYGIFLWIPKPHGGLAVLAEPKMFVDHNSFTHSVCEVGGPHTAVGAEQFRAELIWCFILKLYPFYVEPVRDGNLIERLDEFSAAQRADAALPRLL